MKTEQVHTGPVGTPPAGVFHFTGLQLLTKKAAEVGLFLKHPQDRIVVTEGVFDYITLRRWGINSVALAGNGSVRKLLAELKRIDPSEVVFALDADDATGPLQKELATELECPVSEIALPDGVVDVADLGMLTDGRERLEIALLQTATLAAGK